MWPKVDLIIRDAYVNHHQLSNCYGFIVEYYDHVLLIDVNVISNGLVMTTDGIQFNFRWNYFYLQLYRVKSKIAVSVVTNKNWKKKNKIVCVWYCQQYSNRELNTQNEIKKKKNKTDNALL